MEELVKKIGHRIGEVSDRAVRSVYSKHSTGLCSTEDLLAIDSGAIAALLLHWINERQTQADVQTLNSALRLIQEISQTSLGYTLLSDIQAVEFLNSYYKYVPTTLQTSVSSILNLLISPSFTPSQRPVADIYPEMPALDHIPKPKLILPTVEETSINPSEFPPVLLCESDEKILFDLTVTFKFGSAEEVIAACSELNTRILKDFPCESFLQHSDLIKAIVGLVKTSGQKKNLDIALAALSVLSAFLRKLSRFNERVRLPELRPAVCLAKKMGNKAEYIEISVPGLKNEQWEIGTPGPTMSVLYAVEYIITELPLDSILLLAHVLDVWKEAEWAFPELFKYPKLVGRLFELLANSVTLHTEQNNSSDRLDCGVYIKKIIEVSQRILVSLPVADIGLCLTRNSGIVRYLAEYLIFEGEPCESLLPYIQEIDPSIISEYQYGLKCLQAIEAHKTMKQMLINEKILPVASMSVYFKALEFFTKIMPILEFQPSQNIISSILDLNCYSFFIQQNSSSDCKAEECLNLLLALLTSTLPAITSITLDILEESLSSTLRLTGIASGADRKSLSKQLILNTSVLPLLLIKHKHSKLLAKVLEEPEDYNKILPFFTVVQSFCDENLDGVLHMLTITTPAIQPLRFIRDLFSSDTHKRAIAVMILRNANSPEVIHENWKNINERMWEHRELSDPVTMLAGSPELDSIESKKSAVTEEELLNLLNIFRSSSLEINLKISSAEQIILHMVGGIVHENYIEEIITSAINNLLPDSEDRYVKRLLSKSLQILVLSALKYESRSRKLYNSSVKFICSLTQYIFSTYDQIRHYSMHLIFILAFSPHATRNKFIPTELFALVPETTIKPLGVPMISTLMPGFLMPFAIQTLTPEVHPSFGFVKTWEQVPSSKRIHSLVQNKKKLRIDADAIIDVWGKGISSSESYSKILEICGNWLNTVRISADVAPRVVDKFIASNSEMVTSVLTLLRSPSVSAAEDGLQIAIQQILRSVIAVMKGSKGQMEFIQAVSFVVQKSLLPFIHELTDIATRKSVVLSILSLLQSLLPYHGALIDPEHNLLVLTRFQLEPGPASLLSLLLKFSSLTDDISLLEMIASILITILDHPHLSLTLDLKTSPVCQETLRQISKNLIQKIPPYINPNNFIYKAAGKQLLQLFSRMPELIELDSYMWSIRLTEDRDVDTRVLAWGFLSSKSIECYSIHSSAFDMALEALFVLPESFGVKVQAGRFLCSVMEYLINCESHDYKESILKHFFQYAIISHIKNMMYENAGPPAVYFAVLLTLLNNLLVLEPRKVMDICIQVDVWDGVIRILRPGAMAERASNETRKPFKGNGKCCYEEVLITLVVMNSFLANSIKSDIRVLDYLLESTHFLTHLLAWLPEILSNFDHSQEQLHSKALLSVIDTLHMSLFKSKKSLRFLQEFSYKDLVKILDLSQSRDLKLATARLLTSLFASISPDTCDGLLLHLISLYKSENIASEQKDIVKSLTSLLYYDESSKIIAIQTGFHDYVLESSSKLISMIQNLEIQKTRRREEELALTNQLVDSIILFKLWAANSHDAKVMLSYKENKVGALLRLLFISWPMSLRKEELLKLVLETICTVTSGCEASKKACAIIQDSRQSLLSHIIEYISRPNSTSEPCFHLSLKILGSLCSCKESRQLLIKSKYPQGLAMRLIREWNETKSADAIPTKSPYIIEFLTTFAFFEEGQKVIAGIGGIVDILVEILDKLFRSTIDGSAVEQSLLLLRNLSFSSSTKPHVVANQQALPMLLAYISMPKQKPRLKKLASSTLWALLYHYQKIKGILSKGDMLSKLESVYKEVSRDAEMCKDKDVAAELKVVSENLNCVLKICMGE